MRFLKKFLKYFSQLSILLGISILVAKLVLIVWDYNKILALAIPLAVTSAFFAFSELLLDRETRKIRNSLNEIRKEGGDK